MSTKYLARPAVVCAVILTAACRNPQASPDACVSEFVEYTLDFNGVPASRCVPLPNGITMNYAGCMPREPNVQIGSDPSIAVSAPTGAFDAVGPTTLGVAFHGFTLSCGGDGGYCFASSPACSGEVVIAASVGHVGEARLTMPCTLQATDSLGNPTRTLIVNALRITGTLRPTNNLDTPSPDGGADCGF